MSKVLWVAWREFKHTALTRAFILAAVFVPLGLVGLVLLVGPLLKPHLAPLKGVVAVVVSDGAVANAVSDELRPERIRDRQVRMRDEAQELAEAGDTMQAVEKIQASSAPLPQIDVQVQHVPGETDLEPLKDRVRRGEFVAIAVVKDDALAAAPRDGANMFELFVAADSAPNHTTMFENALSDAIVRMRVERAGRDFAATRSLMAPPSPATRSVAQGGMEAEENVQAKMLIPMAFMVLLWVATFTSGNYLLTSTIEEKANKVMEVLLSAVSPFQLMAGKLLGQAGVSFILLLMYGGLGIVALIAFTWMHMVPLSHMVYLALYFVMAFFMVAALMAGVGSAVSELREAQSLITPVMMLLMIPLVLWLPISENPNGALATITSYVPPLIPFVMILRVTAANEPVPTFQIVSSIIAGYAWMLVMIWMCAKIFRVGVLMYGKPPTPMELLRWVRYR